MNIPKRKQFEALLPATPCSAEMREKMEQVAKREGASMAEIQRYAFSLFLSEFDKNLISSANSVIDAELEGAR